MRIHSDHLTTADIYQAARHARVDVVTEGNLERGSRSRDHAFEVKLEGESRRRPNGGASGKGYASGYAATWDQWGVFLGILFDIDPGAKCWAYDGRDAFQARTNERFVAPMIDVGVSTNYNVVNGRAHHDPSVTVHRLGAAYWPDDAHGDHRFTFQGVPREQSCTKCSAKQTW